MGSLLKFGPVFVFLSLRTVWSLPLDVTPSQSTFRFANIYGHHMVLQKAPGRAVVWGFGEAGQTVRVQLESPSGADVSHETTVCQSQGANGDKIWEVMLDPQEPGGPYTVLATSVVNGAAVQAKITDVYFGDVWICSGQSNMQFSVSQVVNSSDAVAEADNYPHIRLFTALQVQSDTPLVELQTVQQPWTVASSASVDGGTYKYFSAVCWFFGKNLYDRYKYPIGLIATSWGGTAIETWSSPDALMKCNSDQSDSSQISREIFRSPEDVEVFDDLPIFPSKPSVLYNAMIHPFVNMPIYGAIWYQGEANAAKPHTYNCTFPAMIDDWRMKWFEGTGENTDPQFPFGFVQLSSLAGNYFPEMQKGFPNIRWAQTADQGFVPNSRMRRVFMAVSLDLGNASSPWGSIHPNDKQDVGYRLALSGRAIAYNDPVYHTGPLVVDVNTQVLKTGVVRIDLIYTNVGAEGLEIRSDKGFEVYCESPNATSWVSAAITANTFYTVTVLGMCPAGTGDVAGIRYVWNVNPCPFKQCAVYSKAEGLPSGPYIKMFFSRAPACSMYNIP